MDRRAWTCQRASGVLRRQGVLGWWECERKVMVARTSTRQGEGVDCDCAERGRYDRCVKRRSEEKTRVEGWLSAVLIG